MGALVAAALLLRGQGEVHLKQAPEDFVFVAPGTLRPALRAKFYESAESLQVDLDEWLVHYNNERPYLGYRNMGKRPIETVNE